MSAANVRKGKDFERWLALYYGKDRGLAERTGHLIESDGRQSGADVRLEFVAIQAKKGRSTIPVSVARAMAAVLRHTGRRMPAVAMANDGDNQGHLIILRGVDFLRIIELLREHGLAERLLLGANRD